jgi:hypothetical protein
MRSLPQRFPSFRRIIGRGANLGWDTNRRDQVEFLMGADRAVITEADNFGAHQLLHESGLGGCSGIH